VDAVFAALSECQALWPEEEEEEEGEEGELEPSDDEARNSEVCLAR